MPRQAPHRRSLRRGSQGVSLIEALVALAVMAFGMLAVAGLQATMRLNADIAKQRSEAVRIAQEAIESWRGFTVLDAPPAGEVAYADVTNDSAGADVTGLTTNTTYSLQRGVTDDAALRRKVLVVNVRWVDRAGVAQAIQLNSVIASTLPELAATLMVSNAGSPTKLPRGRNAAVPVQARDFGNGTSGFKPPAPGGGSAAWVFNNVTGLVSSVCTVSTDVTNASLALADLSGCTDIAGQVLSGFVRFDTNTAAALTAASAENPIGSALSLDVQLTLTSTGHPSSPICFDDAPTTSTAAATQTLVSYYCLIYANTSRTWSGISTLAPVAFTDLANPAWPIAASGGSNFEVCRYTPAANDAAVVANGLHPRNYSNVTAPQVVVNQNFLVISALWTCPTDVAASPVGGDYVNSNTLVHQPAP